MKQSGKRSYFQAYWLVPAIACFFEGYLFTLGLPQIRPWAPALVFVGLGLLVACKKFTADQKSISTGYLFGLLNRRDIAWHDVQLVHDGRWILRLGISQVPIRHHMVPLVVRGIMANRIRSSGAKREVAGNLRPVEKLLVRDPIADKREQWALVTLAMGALVYIVGTLHRVSLGEQGLYFMMGAVIAPAIPLLGAYPGRHRVKVRLTLDETGIHWLRAHEPGKTIDWEDLRVVSVDNGEMLLIGSAECLSLDTSNQQFGDVVGHLLTKAPEHVVFAGIPKRTKR